MMKKQLLFVWMLVLFSSLALAEPLLVVVVDSSESPSQFVDFAVLEYNSFADTRLYEDHTDDSTSVELVLSDASGAELSRSFLDGPSSIRSFSSNMADVKIVSGGAVLLQRSLRFCDSDGVCEPCEGADCTLLENFLTCSDCSSGAGDSFCNTLEDGVCDPDCDFDLADPDCFRECSQDCGVEDDFAILPFCSDYNGEICEATEDCIGGSMLFTTDSLYCCAGGFCGITGEYIETRMEMIDHPESTITPLGERASDVASEMGSYCVNKLKGSLCEPDQNCDGEMVEFYYDTYCCVGECVRVPPEAYYSEEYMGELMTETSLPPSQDELDALYDMSYDAEAEDAELYGYWDMPEFGADEFEEKERNIIAAEEEMAGDQRIAALKAFVDSFTPAVPEKIKGFSFPILAVSLLVIVLLVSGLVALFRHSAGKRIETESASVSNGELTATDLQPEIDALIAKGFNYTQSRAFLVRKGYRQEIVNAEIMKNYNIRKAAQVKQK
ncbi:hypothetical protein KY359_00415 [Candidatus Woesearchaeota archaeon]|nr:hypothetical protein [Candidatus Woesearchaeota archaeon]